MKSDKKIKCAFLIPDDAWLSTIVTHAEIYSALDFFWKPSYDAKYSSFDISYFNLSGQRARNFSGLCLETTEIDDRQYDIITIPATWRPDVTKILKQTSTLDWLVAQHKGGAIIVGLITGQFYMAAAGLLNGRDATIHNAFEKSFKSHFPEVNIKDKLSVTESDNLICSSGTRSTVEIMMMMIERFCGKEAVQLCAKYYEFDESDWFEGQRMESIKSDSLVEAAIEKIRNQYNKELSLDSLAQKLNVSSRNLSRRFQKATGYTTMRYVQKQRLLKAKQLLTSSTLSIEQIAQQVGFGSASVFGRGFKTEYAKSPLQYRKYILSQP